METNQDLNFTERISKLEMVLYGLEQANSNPHAKNQSFDISELAKSFSKAQAEFAPIGQNRSNPFFKSKYADLDAILKAVRPSLAKNGLSFYQYTSIDCSQTILHSRILHISGQWIESQTLISPPKSDIQSYGSTMSYQRRYSALNILGVATTDDPSDDDGNHVTGGNHVTHDKAATFTKNTSSRITNEQIDELRKTIKGKEVLVPVILKKLNIRNMDEMLQSDFKTIIGIINNYDGKK